MKLCRNPGLKKHFIIKPTLTNFVTYLIGHSLSLLIVLRRTCTNSREKKNVIKFSLLMIFMLT